MKTVFVTVGTTRFDELVEAISSPEGIQVRQHNLYSEEHPSEVHLSASSMGPHTVITPSYYHVYCFSPQILQQRVYYL